MKYSSPPKKPQAGGWDVTKKSRTPRSNDYRGWTRSFLVRDSLVVVWIWTLARRRFELWLVELWLLHAHSLDFWSQRHWLWPFTIWFRTKKASLSTTVAVKRRGAWYSSAYALISTQLILSMHFCPWDELKSMHSSPNPNCFAGVGRAQLDRCQRHSARDPGWIPTTGGALFFRVTHDNHHRQRKLPFL